MEKVTIRGIPLLASPNQAAFADFLINGEQLKCGMLVAINAEKVILSEVEPTLAALLKQSDYNYADGISIVKSIQRKYPTLQIERIAGADLWLALMKRAGEFGVPVFLVGASEDVLAETVARWRQAGVNVVGCRNGYFDDEAALIAEIRQSGAKFVSVALGSPKQEYFIQRALTYYPDCLYMGVGGSYDVFVGKVKRAPKLWQKWGLEWLYRLLKQPTRWQRQLRLLKYAYYYATKQL